ncbi:MAG: RNA methyltransferase [Bacteroidota bacterium]
MQAISKAKIKLFTSLHTKKYRYRHQMFLIEGKKLVKEAIDSGWKLENLVLREDITDWGGENYDLKIARTADRETFNQLSGHQQSEGVIGALHFPTPEFCQKIGWNKIPGERGFVLDAIQDPGNLGSIMRTLDWLNIRNIILGPGCVDPLNLKSLRSSMGAIFRMNIFPVGNLEEMPENMKKRIWLADIEGRKLGKVDFPSDSLILIGNEANGINVELRKSVANKISIPRYGGGESLNASIAASIIAWEMSKA